MHITPHDTIPAGFGGFDSAGTYRALLKQNREADEAAAERDVRLSYLRDQFAISMMQGVASQPCSYAAKRRKEVGGGFRQCESTFADLMADALDDDALKGRAMQMLLDVVHGKDVQAAALQLLVDAGARWADGAVAE